MNLSNRFWSKCLVKRKDECWNWIAATASEGRYGCFRYGKTMKQAHRIAWMLHSGKYPHGICVLHKCDNTLCVNPNHLFTGTQRDNVRDMHKKGRNADSSRPGERNGNAVITQADVNKIIGLRGKYTQREIGRMFGISQPEVCFIQKRRRWATK